MELFYGDTKISNIDIPPTMTIGELKQSIYNWLIPQGITNYKIMLFYNNNTKLDDIVFESKNYDNISFIEHKNLLKGGKIFIRPVINSEKNFDKLPSDIIMLIAMEFDLPDILTYCKLSKRFNKTICDNNIFWMNKLRKDYPFVDIIDVKEYKNLYEYLSKRAKEINIDSDESKNPKFGYLSKLGQDISVYNGKIYVSLYDLQFPEVNPLFWTNIKWSQPWDEYFWVPMDLLKQTKENSKDGISYITGKYGERYLIETKGIEDAIKYNVPKLRWIVDHLEPITLKMI